MALALTERLGFERSCRPEVGRLLHVLAASRGRARLAEIGTGTCVAAAWIVSALPPQTPFFTTEIDSSRASAARELFAADDNVHVLEGDWSCCHPRRRSISSSSTRRSASDRKPTASSSPDCSRRAESLCSMT